MQYRYIVSGMFRSQHGKYYEINIPAPYIRDSKERAEKDDIYGYRFIPNEEQKPVIAVFPAEKFERASNKKSLNVWTEGEPIATYDFDTFKREGGYIRRLKDEKEGCSFINGETDFEDTDETFDALFPDIHGKVYIDSEAYWIQEIKS